MRTSRVVGAALLPVALAAATACGSTVQGAGDGTAGLSSATQPGGGLGAGDGLSGGSSGLGGGGTSPGGGGLASGTGSSPVGGGGGTGQAGAGQMGTGVTAPGSTSRGTRQTSRQVAASIPVKGQGWDATHVYVGVMTQKDAQKAYAAAGASGVDIGDTEAQARAVTADLNRHGGILGRQVVPIFKDEPTVATAENPDQAGNEACSYFTEDHPVIAVFSILSIMDVQSWRACLAKHHVPLFSASSGSVDTQEARSLAPYFYQSSMIPWDRLAPVFVRALKAQGWFGGWNPKLSRPAAGAPKIGILTLDDPSGHRQAAILKSQLAAAGYHDVVTFGYEFPGNNIDPAVFNFNANKVTHVISTDIELFAFQQHAASQHYYPRYGISTYNAPLNNLQGFGAAGENNGSMGVGWAPMYDVDAAHDPGATGPGQKHCDQVMAKGGLNQKGKRLANAFAYAMCDTFSLIQRGAPAGGGFDGVSLYRGLLAMAPKFSSAIAFSTGLGDGRFFVPGAVRELAWHTNCSCFAYAGRSNRV